MYDDDPLREAPEGVYSRRHFLRLAGGISLAALLPASTFVSGAEAAVLDRTTVGGTLNLFTWQGYDLTGPFKVWRKQHHIKQHVKYINNQFDVAAILRGPGGKQYDSSSANQAYTHLFQSLGVI